MTPHVMPQPMGKPKPQGVDKQHLQPEARPGKIYYRDAADVARQAI